MRVQDAVQQVMTELSKTTDKAVPIASPHEGYAFLKDELDDLYEAVRTNSGKPHQRAEAKHIAAMAIRFMIDCT
jgi:hypothetical protein